MLVHICRWVLSCRLLMQCSGLAPGRGKTGEYRWCILEQSAHLGGLVRVEEGAADERVVQIQH